MKRIEILHMPQVDYSYTEAMNMLATNLYYSGDDIKTILVTSRYEEEGKSFTIMNLMHTFASLQKRVVVLDTDLRRSKMVTRFRMRFEMKNPLGLVHYLAGKCGYEDIVYSTNLPGAHIVPIGREASNSLHLLSSPRTGRLISRLREEYDYVLVDTAPAGVIADALEIAQHCDGALLVVSCDRGRKKDIAETTRAIQNTGCPVLGAVMNNVELDSYTNRKYYYKSERYASYYSNYYTKESRRKADLKG